MAILDSSIANFNYKNHRKAEITALRHITDHGISLEETAGIVVVNRQMPGSTKAPAMLTFTPSMALDGICRASHGASLSRRDESFEPDRISSEYSQ